MRVSAAACLLLLPPLLSACSRPPQYVAPAPEDALECALREAIEMGYRRMEGGGDELQVRVSQRPDPPPGDRTAPSAPAPETGQRLETEDDDGPEENQLIFRHENGQLHIQVVSLAEGKPVDQPMPAADSHARRILAACTTS